MNKTSKASNAVLYVSLLAFISFVVYILFINEEVLYTAHDRSEFIFGAPFFRALLSKPFGLMQYVGAWLTQFFCHPALGTGMLVAVWVLVFFVGAKAFRLQGKATGRRDLLGNGASALMILPIACLLASIVDLGYWVYILPIRGYWFSQSVGYLVMLLWLWVARCTPRKWHLLWYLLGVCAYPVLGWLALLFILCLVLADKPSWRELIGIVLLFLTAKIWHTQLYPHLKFDDVVLAGLPRIENSLDSSPHLSIPFWVLGAVSVLISFISLFLPSPSGRGRGWGFIPLLCAAAGIIFTWSFMYRDRNYIDEMRMVRYASDDNWKEVLQMAEKNKRPTTTMVFLKNLALMHEGGLLDRSFKLGNIDFNINNPDSLHISFLNIASPLVYYNYGMMNEAVRLNYELAIQFGFSPSYLKMLSRCALATGDEKLLERYTTILHHHPLYSDWQPAPVAEMVKELQQSYLDGITGVENSDSFIVNEISLWYESDSKVVSEQALLYAMLRCSSHCFWPSLRNYLKLHEGEFFPVHAQEAYILFMDKAPEEKRMMIPVEQDIYERYMQFSETLGRMMKPGLTIGKVAEDMRDEWGDTYWYYFYFGRKPVNRTGSIGSEVHS